MTSITLNSITGLTYPYDIYVCDVYGNNCGYISKVESSIPPTIEIVLPPPFNMSPAVGIKIITSDGCERFKIINCDVLMPLPSCTGSIVPPAIINGITITDSYTGSVSTYLYAFTSCGNITTPPNSKYLGQSGVFNYQINFSSPINYITIFLTGTGGLLNENFIFTTNTGSGIPTILSTENCYTTIIGNEILSGYGSSGTGGGGKFLIHNSTSFTSLTISGNGGVSGSLLSICTNSIL